MEQGSLYPALHRLIKRGWISAEEGVSENRRAKCYRPTAKRRNQLKVETSRREKLARAIGGILDPSHHGLEKTIVTGRLKDRNKTERRLGKIQARHPQVNDLYDVALRETAEGARPFWQMQQDRKSWREPREGVYLLRPDLQAETAEELWAKTCS